MLWTCFHSDRVLFVTSAFSFFCSLIFIFFVKSVNVVGIYFVQQFGYLNYGNRLQAHMVHLNVSQGFCNRRSYVGSNEYINLIRLILVRMRLTTTGELVKKKQFYRPARITINYINPYPYVAFIRCRRLINILKCNKCMHYALIMKRHIYDKVILASWF